MAKRFASGDCVTVVTEIGTKLGTVVSCRRKGRGMSCSVRYDGRGGVDHSVSLRNMQHCRFKVGRFKRPVRWDAQGMTR